MHWKRKKMIRHFIDDLENSFDNSDEPGEDWIIGSFQCFTTQ